MKNSSKRKVGNCTITYDTTELIPAPTAKISKNKSLLQIYKTHMCNNTVFLNDKAEYEIELFNPMTIRVLAKIKIDGKYISNTGIVIRPGERVWLERFIDDNRKFKFSTYSVEDTEESRKAIQNNGNISVEFYYEKVNISRPFYQLFTYPYNEYYNPISGWWTTCGDNISSQYNFSCTSNSQLKTGITEKGSKSNQKFVSTTGDFESFYNKIIDIKILPAPMAPELFNLKFKKHCPKCGKKVKEQWSYCTNCAAKL